MLPSVPARRYTHLISSRGDAILAISAGFFSYWLYERDNPREPGKSLYELAERRIKKWSK
ncbi:hypothetical protein K7432_003485 [Basidiobolus ranarum]|uniref:Uncharacterized protein n=1 Tax=Basidiobolus ranarum TaxID=34480 RepID=A0ABR2WZQ2_9FUNG